MCVTVKATEKRVTTQRTPYQQLSILKLKVIAKVKELGSYTAAAEYFGINEKQVLDWRKTLSGVSKTARRVGEPGRPAETGPATRASIGNFRRRYYILTKTNDPRLLI